MMTPETLDEKIERLLYEELALRDGEMMMPPKQVEIDNLRHAIHCLVDEAVRAAAQ